MGLDNIEGVKEGCEGDVQSEILAGGDWTRCCSPPLTPGTFYFTSAKNDHSLVNWFPEYIYQRVIAFGESGSNIRGSYG